jgi:hypothetical protein
MQKVVHMRRAAARRRIGGGIRLLLSCLDFELEICLGFGFWELEILRVC